MPAREFRPTAPVAVADDFWGPEYVPAAQALLSSAAACFAEKGFVATTTRDIGRGAGLSSGALYVHFGSKEDALFTIIRVGHLRFREALGGGERARREMDPVDTVRELVGGLVRWHATNTTVARVCQFEMPSLEDGHLDEIGAIRRGITDIFRYAISRGVSAGVFGVREADVPRLVRAIVSLGVDLVRWYRPDGPDSPDEVAEFYVGLALQLLRVD